MIFLEFFKSPSWRDIQARFYATLGLAGAGTMANVANAATPEQTEQLIKLEILIKFFALGSYILSGIVAITVIIKFIIWLYDRQKNNKNKDNGSDSNND